MGLNQQSCHPSICCTNMMCHCNSPVQSYAVHRAQWSHFWPQNLHTKSAAVDTKKFSGRKHKTVNGCKWMFIPLNFCSKKGQLTHSHRVCLKSQSWLPINFLAFRGYLRGMPPGISEATNDQTHGSEPVGKISYLPWSRNGICDIVALSSFGILSGCTNPYLWTLKV